MFKSCRPDLDLKRLRCEIFAVEEENFERSLRAFSQRRPFKPFLVELAGGTQLTIDHPEALARRGPVAVYIDLAGNYTLFDSTGVTQLTDNTGNG
jgi:hypothetical protein